MKNCIIKLISLLFAAAVILGAAVGIFNNGDTCVLTVADAAQTADELSFKTEFYRFDEHSDSWVYTEKAAPGEKVKARLFVETDYFTNAGDIIVFYSDDFFADSYLTDTSDFLTVNDSPDSSAAINGVSGSFAKLSKTNRIITNLIKHGYIAEEFAESHTGLAITYHFSPAVSKKISGEQWFAEFELQVLETATGEGKFFVVEETIMNSADGVYAHINLPVGKENSSVEETTGLFEIDVETSVTYYPLTTQSTVVLKAGDGMFADGTNEKEFVKTVGEEFIADEPVRVGCKFDGWVDENGEKTADKYIVPAKDTVLTASWVEDEPEFSYEPSIKISSLPNKTSYTYKGGNIDLSGIAIDVTKENGETETVTDISKIKATGFDASKIGSQVITVEYDGLTAVFEVEVEYAWWQWIIRILLLGFLWY